MLKNNTDDPRYAILSILIAGIAALAISLGASVASAQHGSGGRGGGGGSSQGGGSHTSHDSGHTSHDTGHTSHSTTKRGPKGKRGTREVGSGRGSGRSLRGVFREMDESSTSKGKGKSTTSTAKGKRGQATKSVAGTKKATPKGKKPTTASAKKGKPTTVKAVDDDSDRPVWAMGNPELNPHSGGGGGQPDAAGTKKGDLYGDLIMLKRDPVTGLAEQTDEGEYLICLDATCTKTEPTVGLEVPEGVIPIEIEFGRSSVARAPDKVTEKALADALAKLTADGVILGTEASGRITYTVDGVTSTIDSPLENLALYIDLLKGLASDTTATETETALGDLATLNTAAALLAGVADKTGDINIDYVYYQNLITGTAAAAAPDTYYDYGDFTYTRNYPTDYSYWLSIDGADPVSQTLNINDYLSAVNGDLPTQTGEDLPPSAALFAAAADDALEVIELLHTQVHTELLPGTVIPLPEAATLVPPTVGSFPKQ